MKPKLIGLTGPAGSGKDTADHCRAEVEHQRQVLRSLANTESIALYMEGKAA